MVGNVVAGRNAAQFNAAEQDNITRRIVALRVFGGIYRFVIRVWLRCLTVFQNSSRDRPLPALILRRDLFSNAWKCGERARSKRSKSSSSSGAIKTAAVLPLRVMTTGPFVGNSSM